MTNITPPLTQEALKELSDFLSGTALDETEPVTVSFAHGLFCALHSLPELLPPEDWLGLLCDGGDSDEMTAEHVKAFERGVALVMQLFVQTAERLEQDVCTPLFYPLPDPDDTDAMLAQARLWSLGYLMGVTLFDEEWNMNEDAMVALSPLLVLSSPEGFFDDIYDEDEDEDEDEEYEYEEDEDDEDEDEYEDDGEYDEEDDEEDSMMDDPLFVKKVMLDGLETFIREQYNSEWECMDDEPVEEEEDQLI